jgi:hypothetical protein
MYIIDKHKDYYDFHSHIFGVDKKVVFDRRGSRKLDDTALIPKSFPHWRSVHDITFLLLEVGYVQYLIQLSNIKEIIDKGRIDSEYQADFEIVREFREHKHRYGPSPMTIMGVELGYDWTWRWDNKEKYNFEDTFDNLIRRELVVQNLPILADTSITSLISSKEIWIELQTYISSLNNDVDVTLPMTDEERAETHGFNRKTSFRNPIK